MENSIIYGKKTIGFPTTMQDIPHLVSLLREDKTGNMGKFCLKNFSSEDATLGLISMFANNNIKCWTFSTKQGKGAKVCCYILLDDITPFSCSLMGMMDLQFAKGLTTQLRKEKYTYSEDALRGGLGYIFKNLGLSRIEAEIMEFNRKSMALVKKVGFKREGIKRRAFDNDGKFVDVHIFALLKEEYSNG